VSIRIIIFAKAPQPGEVKTRLIPVLGPAGAASLHEYLVAHALAIAKSAEVGPVELCCAPDASHSFFAACAAKREVVLTEQGPGDLGDRMHRAATRALSEAAGVILIGADCAVMTPEYLRAAAAALDEGSTVVVGPAEDGGYVLIALARPDPALFDGIRWGSAHVLEETRARLRILGWRWRELATLWDVDRPVDLERLPELGELPAIGSGAMR
jgi:rSAM/selenodomain-associated transferase 1